jgi:phosphonate degradation associated HDIG domain protein
MSAILEVERLFTQRGAEAYYGEAVTMAEHCLQAAHFAMQAHAPEHLVMAALLHDIGHLVEEVPADIADWTVDAHHEQVGAYWLSSRFPAEVCEPVRLHVPAKRYLCAVSPQYLGQLSEASVLTLNLQGGPMSEAEVARFRDERFHREAVRVRLWDDQGKVAGLNVAPLTVYRDSLERWSNSALRPATF